MIVILSAEKICQFHPENIYKAGIIKEKSKYSSKVFKNIKLRIAIEKCKKLIHTLRHSLKRNKSTEKIPDAYCEPKRQNHKDIYISEHYMKQMKYRKHPTETWNMTGD